MMGNKKLQVWLPLLFSIVMILGMFFGYRLAGGRQFLKTGRQSSLQETLDLIRLHYDQYHRNSGECVQKTAA